MVYDRASGDFFAACLRPGIGGTNKSQINLAVSSNPLGSWSVYAMSVENLLQDQPTPPHRGPPSGPPLWPTHLQEGRSLAGSGRRGSVD